MGYTDREYGKETIMSKTDNSEVIKERIKAKPLNRKKLLRKTVITVSMALIFGLVASVTFLLLQPVFSKMIHSKDEQKPEQITFPEAQEEILPSDLLTDEDLAALERDPDGGYLGDNPNDDNPYGDNPGTVGVLPNEGDNSGNGDNTDSDELTVEFHITEEQYQALITGMEISLSDYKLLYAKLAEVTRTFNKSMVDVIGESTDEVWFDGANKNTNQSCGVIIQSTAEEYLVLVDYRNLMKSDSLTVTFHDGMTVAAELRRLDQTTGYAVVRVPMKNVPENTRNSVMVAPLGSSNSNSLQGSIVIALGSPMGVKDSQAYGIITSLGNPVELTDRNYSMLTTDIYGSRKAGGIVMSLNGQILGVIDNRYNASDVQNLLSFVGISELKRTIENMSNDIAMPYAGIKGVDVTYDIAQKYGLPRGAYVKEVEMDSPAMACGIQSGDIIVKINNTQLQSFTDYSNTIMSSREGDTLNITVMRSGQNEYQEVRMEMTIGSR